jgi:hypothetical protein
VCVSSPDHHYREPRQDWLFSLRARTVEAAPRKRRPGAEACEIYAAVGHGPMNDHDLAETTLLLRFRSRVSGTEFDASATQDARAGSRPSSTCTCVTENSPSPEEAEPSLSRPPRRPVGQPPAHFGAPASLPARAREFRHATYVALGAVGTAWRVRSRRIMLWSFAAHQIGDRAAWPPCLPARPRLLRSSPLPRDLWLCRCEGRRPSVNPKPITKKVQ